MVLRGSVYSNTLEMETGISVVTPNDYGQTDRYRVCYVLHGLCGGNADFSNYTMLPYYAYDKDVIYICPEVQRSFYQNTAYGMRYFDFVSQELPHIAKLVFNISADRAHTAVMGCSMGGYGALKCALTYPEQYGFCAALSPAFTTMSDALDRWRETGDCKYPFFYDIFGKDLAYDAKDDVTTLAERAVRSGVTPDIYLCTGDEDFLRDENRAFAAFLQGLQYPLTFEELHGKHDFYLFGQGVQRAVALWRR